MDTRIRAYREAARRAVAFQLRYQQADGGYVWDGYAPDAFHKQSYAWGNVGEAGKAHRLLNWVAANRLGSDGELTGYRGDAYKHSWFIQGAHRLGRYDLSFPAFQATLRAQTPCGGLVHLPADPYCRILPSCWFGVAAVGMGQLEVAERIMSWASSVCSQQSSDGCFYFLTTRSGELVDASRDPDRAQCIDFAQKQQCYWEIGLPLQLACRLYMATGRQRYLDEARRFFEWHQRCGSDAYSCTSSGKSGLGAALFYLVSGSTDARERAIEFADHLLETQLPQGAWHNPAWPDQILYYIDAAAEFAVWLTEIANILEAGAGATSQTRTTK